MAGPSDDDDWQASIAELKKMAHDVAGLPPSVKHMIEQRELLAQAKRKIES